MVSIIYLVGNMEIFIQKEKEESEREAGGDMMARTEGGERYHGKEGEGRIGTSLGSANVVVVRRASGMAMEICMMSGGRVVIGH